MEDGKIFAMIPARIGSTRLKMKNLALIGKFPMIYYPINAALNSNIFDEVIVNSDHQIFGEVAERYNANFYKRSKKLGSSETMADEVVFDFFLNHPDCNILCWVNPTSPFQTSDEIVDTVSYFIEESLDSLITIEEKYVHALKDNIPVNFSINEPFTQTQNLIPIDLFAYSVMMWKREPFMAQFQKEGHALFCGKFGTFPISKKTGILIKKEEDLILCDLLMTIDQDVKLKYDPIVDKLD